MVSGWNFNEVFLARKEILLLKLILLKKEVCIIAAYISEVFDGDVTSRIIWYWHRQKYSSVYINKVRWDNMCSTTYDEYSVMLAGYL